MKSDWIAVDNSGVRGYQSRHRGMNVSTMNAGEIKRILKEGIKDSGLSEVEGFYLYIAGVLTKNMDMELRDFISRYVKCGEIDIQDDLTGAARGVCGHQPGIVAILGTGSNVCTFDGCNAIRRAYSGGFILGDEGSAAALGRMFIGDFLKGLVPQDIAEDFSKRFESDYRSIIWSVYHGSAPSAYLAGFAPFIISHYQDSKYVAQLVRANFKAFIDRTLFKYDIPAYKLNVVGSFGYNCRKIFMELAKESGILIDKFIPYPIEGLVTYHLSV